jgi:hypothetical protein
VLATARWSPAPDIPTADEADAPLQMACALAFGAADLQTELQELFQSVDGSTDCRE